MKTISTCPSEPGLVKASQLAIQLGVGPRTIRNWAKAHMIPVAYMAGCTMRFNPEAVELALAKATVEGLALEPECRHAAAAAGPVVEPKPSSGHGHIG